MWERFLSIGCFWPFRDGFFYRDVLSKESADLEELGSVSGQLILILGIGSVLTFVLVAAGTRSLGKVSILLNYLSRSVSSTIVTCSLGKFSILSCWQPCEG
jgi:hypothetical protein